MIPGKTKTRRPRGLRRVTASFASCASSRYSDSPKYATRSAACAPERNSATSWSSCRSPRLGALASAITRSGGHRRVDGVAYGLDGVGSCRALAPDCADAARRNRPAELLDRQALPGAERAARRQLRQQGDAEPGGHHLPQRLEARRTIVLALLDVDAAADVQRLVAQTMAVFEQQQRLAGEIVELHVGAFRERTVRRHREREVLVVQRSRFQAVERHGQCEDAELDVAGAQLFQQRLRLVLVKHHFEPRQLL